MTWGGWSIEREVFDFMVETLPRDALVVELGSGAASIELAKQFRLVSYEHDLQFVANAQPPRWNIHHAQLVSDGWYDSSVVAATIPKSYSALLIDGPPTGARRLKMLNHLDLFDWEALVIIDDLHRGEEKQLASKLAAHVGRELRLVKCRQKSFGVL